MYDTMLYICIYIYIYIYICVCAGRNRQDSRACHGGPGKI